MVRTNKFDLTKDKKLAIEVEKQPGLYNKGCKVYKERDRCKNTSAQIEQNLGLEEGMDLFN